MLMRCSHSPRLYFSGLARRCNAEGPSPVAATHAQNSPQAQGAAPLTDLPAVSVSPAPSTCGKRRQGEALGDDDGVEGDEGHRPKRRAPSPSASSSSAVAPSPLSVSVRRRMRRSRRRRAAPAPEAAHTLAEATASSVPPSHLRDAKERDLEERERAALEKERELAEMEQVLARERAALEADKTDYGFLCSGVEDSMHRALRLLERHTALKGEHAEVLARMEAQSERFRRSQASLLEENAHLRCSFDAARRSVDSLQDEIFSLRCGYVLRQHCPHACSSACSTCHDLV